MLAHLKRNIFILRKLPLKPATVFWFLKAFGKTFINHQPQTGTEQSPTIITRTSGDAGTLRQYPNPTKSLTCNFSIKL